MRKSANALAASEDWRVNKSFSASHMGDKRGVLKEEFFKHRMIGVVVEN